MPRFAGEYQETFTVDVPIAAARAHFGDLEVIARHHGELERMDRVDEHTIHYVLVPKSEKGVTFNGEYTCRYEFRDEDTFAWTTIDSPNLWSSGTTRFQAVGEGRTRVTWSQRMECEMKVNRLLAKVIKGIVSREIARGGKQFLARMREALPR